MPPAGRMQCDPYGRFIAQFNVGVDRKIDPYAGRTF
jgi:hypothetical protein